MQPPSRHHHDTVTTRSSLQSLRSCDPRQRFYLYLDIAGHLYDYTITGCTFVPRNYNEDVAGGCSTITYPTVDTTLLLGPV